MARSAKPGWIGCVVVCAALAGGCSSPAPEERIGAVFEGARDAVATRDLDGLMDTISDVYRDDIGRNKTALRMYAGSYLAQSGDIYVWVRDRELELDGHDVALMTARVAIADRPVDAGSDWTDIRADFVRVRVGFGREDDDWRIVTTAWEPLTIAEFTVGATTRRG